ncbi:MAG TPA: tetratricopeptide repeat protein, partial [Actinoplanes sp.]|nr:tetratricopeptide repeat protein [Actinoplanes sp.]
MSDALINSLAAAVEARPDDLTLRLHLAEMLVSAGRGPEAIGHAAQVLAREPGNLTAQQLMGRALGGATPVVPPQSPPQPSATAPGSQTPPGSPTAPGSQTPPGSPTAPGPQTAPGEGPQTAPGQEPKAAEGTPA